MFTAFRRAIIWENGNLYRPISEETALNLARVLHVLAKQSRGRTREIYSILTAELQDALFEVSQWSQKHAAR